MYISMKLGASPALHSVTEMYYFILKTFGRLFSTIKAKQKIKPINR